MADKVTPGPICGNPQVKEAVCVHTNKVYDSCKSKDCLEDLRVYLTRCSQAIVDKAINIKAKKAELLWVYIDVEAVPFNKGFYTVDVRFFYKITAEAFCGTGRPHEVVGLCTCDKRTILFGSEGNARIFTSRYVPNDPDIQTYEKSNMPNAVVEVVNPLCLNIKLVEKNHHRCDGELEMAEIPAGIGKCFFDDIVLGNEGKKVYVTLGQFSIIRIERDIQLLMPAYDICIPQKDCYCSVSEDPCETFEKFQFPVDEFFPPRKDRRQEEFSNRSSCNTGAPHQQRPASMSDRFLHENDFKRYPR